MAAIHVRGVPASTVAALRERARRHGHSVQQEVREILEAAATEPVPGDPVPEIELITTRSGTGSTWRREDTYGDEGR